MFPNGFPRKVAESIADFIMRDQAKLSFVYRSNFGSLVEEQGKLLVPIHVITKGENLNKWGVTDEARHQSAESMKDTILLGPPDEEHPGTMSGGPEGAPHEGDWYPIKGQIIDTVSNGMTYGIASIEDPYAIENIKNGHWKAVSPSVVGLANKTKDGGILFHDYKFQHILFMPEGERPAYPKAGVKGWIEQAGLPSSFEVALQGALEHFTVESKDETNVGTRPSPNQVARSRKKMGKDNNSESTLKDDKKQLSPEEMQEQYDAQAIEIATLKTELKTLKEASTSKQGKEDKVEKQGAEDKTKELEARLKAAETFQSAIAKRDHALLVEETLQAMKHAGQISDEKAEKTEQARLDALTDDTLREIKKMAERSAAVLKTIPTLKRAESFAETPHGGDAKERLRQAMFGYSRDKDFKKLEAN